MADSDGQVSLRWVSVDSEYSRARITSAKLPFVRPPGSVFVSFVCIGQLATVSVSVKVLSDRKLPVSGSEVADNRRKLPASRSEKADNRRDSCRSPIQRRLTTGESCRSPKSEESDNRMKLRLSRSGVADIRKKLPVSRSGRLPTSRSCRSPGLSVVVEKMSSSSSQVVKN